VLRIEPSYSPADFARLVADESDELERKSGLGLKPLQEAMVAFSNTRGGVVFVGVADDGTVLGRRLDQAAEEQIHDAAFSARDLGRYEIRSVRVGDKDVIAVGVLRREEGFAQTSDGRVLVRRGGRNAGLFGSDLTRFLQDRALRRFELTPVALAVQDADPELLEALRTAYGWRDGLHERLQERGLAAEDGSLTVAGALFLTDPSASLGQQKAVIEVRRHPDDTADYDRREVFDGPIHRQVAAATAFITDELGSELIVTGLYRHELPRLPEVVIREALANAVAHRSYEAQGAAVVVELRPDRVVVTSPGALPEPVTVANIRQAQAARNPSLIDVLRRYRLAEDAGRGIDVMQDEMRAALLDPPSFEEEGGRFVRVVLPLRGPITARERVWVQELEADGQLEPGDLLLLVHAARGERLTNAVAREVLSVGEAEARRALRRLTQAALLCQHGARGGAHYTLADDIAPPAAYRMSAGELADLLVGEASREPLTNERVRTLTGLDRPAALAVLRRLVAEGRLRRTGQRRGTRYEAV